MKEITNEMLLKCLQFIQDNGGEVSRYSFDKYITRNILVKESFNIVPKKLVEEGFINIVRDGKEVKITLTQLGIDKVGNSHV
ncbi:hypothetical protein JMN32_22445 [Fulvivirga sp. 29W222]|uniref:Uncharacterized protein n=1 Tax=Fulvivirga marina TaxID=2494733 RepID=A0A937KGD6_9BACT|nr:hypothetical protein [Fulvivirga marina]MBL6449088.1 hypothetical protein [Fulvivirga marina]